MQPSLMPKLVGSSSGHLDLSRIAQDLQIRKVQVEHVVQLLDEGNTVPFITRYRKERTGGLNEEVIRTIQGRVQQLRQLAERKQTILKSIEGQGKLTEDLHAAILEADTPKRLEDLYLPYKPKKRTLATVARERGLEPLAQAIWSRDPAVANLNEVVPTLVNTEKELHNPEEVLLGVQHILAEQISEIADVRAVVRMLLWDTGKLSTTKHEKLAENMGLDYKNYFQFAESIRDIPPHRILAINRGEKENALQVKLEWDQEAVQRAVLDKLSLADHPHAEFIKQAAMDALTRLLLPSLEREIRRELTNRSESHAVNVFARNLRSLLLAPPLRGRRVLAVDPGFRTGCKIAALDEVGNLLEDGVIFPHRPQSKRTEAKIKLEEMLRKHQLSVIAIGNGTACRETEEFIAGLLADLEKRQGGIIPPSEPAVAVVPEPAVPPAQESAAPAITPPESTPSGTSVVPSTENAVVPTTPEVPPTTSNEMSTTPSAPPVVDPAAPPVAPADVPTSIEAPIASDIAGVVATPTPAEEGKATSDVPPSAAPATSPKPAEPVKTIKLAVDPSLPPAPADLAYVIVNEAGASVYSASPVGREEFPQFDATTRGTISIGRRLQDPLSEMVKIDPQHVGVGLYQHDVSPRQLKESLEAIVESCVNQVGVDLNTASVPLLRYISGLNQVVARELVEYRKQHGPFRNREQLLQIAGVGPVRYVQAAGFLKISGGDDPLDRTWIHPESYSLARQLLVELGYQPQALEDRQKTDELREKLKTLPFEEMVARLNVGAPTLRDIIDALGRPGRDPREDLPPPIFKKGILKLEDLQPAMELRGTVLNVVDFGAFVDIGLKDSGLVHISQMANRYVKSPYDVVAVGDVVTVWVLTVDQQRRRVSLTMIQPGTERKPPEKKPAGPPQREHREGPPRGDRRPLSAPQGGAQPAAAGRRPLPPRGGPPRGRTPASTPQQQPPQRAPRRPQRAVPRPKLSQAALQGEAPLRTFSELAAFLEAKQKPAEPAATTPPQEPESPSHHSPKTVDPAKPLAATPPQEPESPPAPETPETQG